MCISWLCVCVFVQLMVRQVCAGGGVWACVAAEVLRRFLGQEAAGAGMGGGFYVYAHAVVLAVVCLRDCAMGHQLPAVGTAEGAGCLLHRVGGQCWVGADVSTTCGL